MVDVSPGALAVAAVPHLCLQIFLKPHSRRIVLPQVRQGPSIQVQCIWKIPVGVKSLAYFVVRPGEEFVFLLLQALFQEHFRKLIVR